MNPLHLMIGLLGLPEVRTCFEHGVPAAARQGDSVIEVVLQAAAGETLDEIVAELKASPTGPFPVFVAAALPSEAMAMAEHTRAAITLGDGPAPSSLPHYPYPSTVKDLVSRLPLPLEVADRYGETPIPVPRPNTAHPIGGWSLVEPLANPSKPAQRGDSPIPAPASLPTPQPVEDDHPVAPVPVPSPIPAPLPEPVAVAPQPHPAPVAPTPPPVVTTQPREPEPAPQFHQPHTQHFAPHLDVEQPPVHSNQLGQVISVWGGKGGVGKQIELGMMVPVPVSDKNPDGWTRHGDLQIGDLVYTPQGHTTRVLALSAIMNNECYELHFSDGQKIIAGADHLWKVSSYYSRERHAPHREKRRLRTVATREAEAARLHDIAEQLPADLPEMANSQEIGNLIGLSRKRVSALLPADLRTEPGSRDQARNAPVLYRTRDAIGWFVDRADRFVDEARTPGVPLEQVLTTEEMWAKRRAIHHGRTSTNWAIRLTNPIHGPDLNLPVAPYTLGAWLGDGSKRTNTIASTEPEVLEQVEADGYHVTRHEHTHKKSDRWAVSGLLPHLREAGVHMNRHIPSDYMRASTAQRLALLQGLNDTDGHVRENGLVEWSQSDHQLAHQYLELVRSLGIKATISEQMVRYTLDGGNTYTETKTVWTITYTTTQPVFRLPRQVARLPKTVRATQEWLYITDIVPVGKRESSCIVVEDLDHMYLVAGFVQTHNSSMAQAIASHAANSGLRTVLLDGNVGQGDQRLLLGIPKRAQLPSMFDIAVSGDPDDGICTPRMINALRSGKEEARFALIPTPPDTFVNDARITPELYLRTVRHFRRKADLVVVDTQIIESRTRSIFTDFILTLWLEGGWGVGIAEGNLSSVSHLSERLHDFVALGVDPARQMYMLNKIGPDTPINIDKLRNHLSRVATYAGSVHMDDHILHLSNQGQIIRGVQTMDQVVDRIMQQVQGTASPTAASREPSSKPRRRLWPFGGAR